MARITLLAALVSAAWTTSIEAQQTARASTVGAALYWVHNREQNEQVSPLRYAGAGTGFALAYGTGSDDWRTGLQLLYASTQLSTDISNSREHTGRARRLELRIPYQRRVFGGTSRLAGFRLGAQLASDLFYRNHTYSTNLPTEHFIDAFTWLGLVGGWQSRPGAGWQVHYSAALPLVGMVWRTPYTGAKYMPPAQLTLPNTMIGLENRLSFTRRLSAALDFHASYDLRLLRHEATWNLATASQRIGMGLDWYVRRPNHSSATSVREGAQ